MTTESTVFIADATIAFVLCMFIGTLVKAAITEIARRLSKRTGRHHHCKHCGHTTETTCCHACLSEVCDNCGTSKHAS